MPDGPFPQIHGIYFNNPSRKNAESTFGKKMAFKHLLKNKKKLGGLLGKTSVLHIWGGLIVFL